ncbi:30S ribosomal protein S6e [archaeon]|jgi:small subunit ribosomal protein S6e|nr:30S ribosomal protein S6e [archaeon]MBT3731434.1 30S ribosomal protein S6e [archaeon]MBT4670263.1 30S ribosomal protein S6e [archaeon]MBT5029719.1 30S ribosomal protein S6e [archaeon]MBT5287532.1 30S ribosomal protein S6e [archaeon]
MAEFKFVINDVKTGKTFQKALEDESVIGKKIGEKLNGGFLGLEGYELEIKGGSDSAGFPMKSNINSSQRRKLLLSRGTAMRKNRAGLKIRKTVCGNTISSNITQINLKVIKYGAKSLEDIFAPKEEAPKAE